jgi:regulatory protein
MTPAESHSRDDDRRRPRRRGPKRATPEYLEKAALHYLERYASSSANLRRVLLAKVERSARAHGTDRDEGARAVERILRRFLDSGLLDDRAYAEGRAVTLHRAGHGTRAIRARLARKGIDEETVDAALARLEDEAAEPELAAALRYARKRRLGPYRPAAARGERRERDMAALARKGFSPHLARRIVDADDADELEAEAGARPGPLG